MSKHYMRKGDDDIVAVPANEWAKYRVAGYEFSNEADYNEQQAAAVASGSAPSEEKVSKKKRHSRRQ